MGPASVEHGLIERLRPPPAHSRRPPRDAHAPVIAFVAAHADSPEHRLERYRFSNPVIIGAGHLVGPLTVALVATGVARVRLLVTTERPTDVERIRESVELEVRPDPRQRVEIDRFPSEWVPDGDTGAVLHVAEVPRPVRALRVARLCSAGDLVFGQATIVGDRAWIGPVGPARMVPLDAVTASWAGAGGPGVGDDRAGELLAGSAAALAAGHLCSTYFQQVTAPRAAASSRLRVLDLATLRVSTVPAGRSPG